MTGAEFEPRIIGFLCNWCSYAGADLAGVSRLQYPPNLRVIRVMCSGRVDPVVLFDAFINGADGVIVCGCHPGDCHYLSGNLHAEKKIKMTRKLLKEAGFQEDRLRLEWVSASEGQKFAGVMKDFTNQIRAMGPSPVHGAEEDRIAANLKAARGSAADFRLRALVSKERLIVDEGNVYGEKKSQVDFDSVIDGAVTAELARKKILSVTRDKPLSVKEIASLLNTSPQKVLEHIIVLRKKNQIGLAGVEGYTPRYVALAAGVT